VIEIIAGIKERTMGLNPNKMAKKTPYYPCIRASSISEWKTPYLHIQQAAAEDYFARKRMPILNINDRVRVFLPPISGGLFLRIRDNPN
jgi:hypothetical protein